MSGTSGGRGLFFGVELVRDRATKAPFDPALSLHARIKREGMARGIMTYPMGGTIDGRLGDHVLLAPPFTVSEDELGIVVDRLGAGGRRRDCNALAGCYRSGLAD